MTELTPSQTVGPFLSIGLIWADGPHVVEPDTPGAIRVYGQVLDGTGTPVPDAIVETWQADPDGYFDHPDDPRGTSTTFRGFGRCPTAGDGTYEIVTRKPGPVPSAGSDVPQAPHIDVTLLARGLLNRVITRIYFDDEATANEADPVLSTVVDTARRATLIARSDGSGGYRFDIRLQGEHETVFFAI
jgi:protocatechuate 3,4-dioxygenase alpha subunit